MAKMISHALAKVNLALRVVGKSLDNYHELESIFVFLGGLYDTLKLDTERRFDTTSGHIHNVPEDCNSIRKAHRILTEHLGIEVPHVEIVKNIPTEGGLGGGSSDSACFVNSVLNLKGFTAEEKLKYLDAFNPLGSDAKVFLYKYFTDCRAVYLNGTGLEGDIRAVELNTDHYVIVVNNGARVSTPAVFRRFAEPTVRAIGPEEMLDASFRRSINSLQNAVVALEPSLSGILDALEGTNPVTYGVSGTGGSCFGLYKSKNSAETAVGHLPYEYVKLSHI